MKIKSIKQISTSKYAVVIDDNKYNLYDDVLIKFNLLSTKEIDDNTFNLLIERNNYYDAYHKILNFISFKLRTEKEIKNKLYSLKIDNKIIYEILDNLKRNNLIDNDKYLNSYINDQLNLTLNGPKKIEQNLIKLGFKKEEYNNLLSDIDSNIWVNRCTKLIDKKLKEKVKGSSKSTYQKYKIYLNNLGYNEKHYSSYLNSISFDDNESLKKDYDKLYKKYYNKYDEEDLRHIIKQKLYAKGYSLAKIEQIKKDF